MKKIVTVVGARPQFIKSAPVSLALKVAGIEEVLVHTGQHYDDNMSAVFFRELNLPQPRYPLTIGSGSHAYQTGEALQAIEEILIAEKPEALLVYGDTNATLSGALAAAKLHIPVAHVEAGLRSFNRLMPEEINRVLTDHLSGWLFAPTRQAVANLEVEGIRDGVFHSGDVMLDALQLFQSHTEPLWNILAEGFGLEDKGFILLTTHRAETTDQPEALFKVLSVLDGVGMPVLYPVHPRVRPLLEAAGDFRNIRLLEPVSYFQMIQLEAHCAAIVTDSGGIQKEAAFAQVPCITLRSETEWVETVETGWNRVVGLSPQALGEALDDVLHRWVPLMPIHVLYGNGKAAVSVVKFLQEEAPRFARSGGCPQDLTSVG